LLEKYTKMFSNLRTDKGRNRYPATTRHRAPHKSLLLLSVTDLIGPGQITRNFMEWDKRMKGDGSSFELYAGLW
jgi:hypothetical protein